LQCLPVELPRRIDKPVAHGGELAIEAGEEQGAVFTIRLPLRERRMRLLEAASTVEEAQQ